VSNVTPVQRVHDDTRGLHDRRRDAGREREVEHEFGYEPSRSELERSRPIRRWSASWRSRRARGGDGGGGDRGGASRGGAGRGVGDEVGGELAHEHAVAVAVIALAPAAV
jgi:hypothetical protein